LKCRVTVRYHGALLLATALIVGLANQGSAAREFQQSLIKSYKQHPRGLTHPRHVIESHVISEPQLDPAPD